MALAAVGVRGVIVGKVCVRVRAPGPCRLIYMCACLVCNMKKKSGHISSKFPGNKAGFREKYFPEKSPFFKEILRDAKLPMVRFGKLYRWPKTTNFGQVRGFGQVWTRFTANLPEPKVTGART